MKVCATSTDYDSIRNMHNFTVTACLSLHQSWQSDFSWSLPTSVCLCHCRAVFLVNIYYLAEDNRSVYSVWGNSFSRLSDVSVYCVGVGIDHTNLKYLWYLYRLSKLETLVEFHKSPDRLLLLHFSSIQRVNVSLYSFLSWELFNLFIQD